MKTTQFKAVKAYAALANLGDLPFKLHDAYRIMMMRKALEPFWEFQVAEENKLINKMNPTVKDGVAIFGSPEQKEQFEAKQKEIYAMVLEVPIEPMQIDLVENDSVKISANDLMRCIDDLADYISFQTPKATNN